MHPFTRNTAMAQDPPALFPPLEPYDSGMLSVEAPHRIYWEQSGNPQGLPVVTLHGGPGGGSLPIHRQYFDPARHRIVTFDQRGCGRSTPHAAMDGNNTQALVGDLERLRGHLGIERWIVCGGSWGSFLALAYGQTHAESCLGILLRGIFLGRKHEIHWWFHGIRNLFPERWETFAGHFPESEREDLLHACHHRLIDPDPAVHLPVAVALRTYSAWTQTFRENPEHVQANTSPQSALALARLFTQYCVYRGFLPPGALLTGVGRLRKLPCAIVQGRYDVVTPMRSAHELAQAWPEAEFTVVTEANHMASEPAMADAVVEAFKRLVERVENCV